MKKVTKPKFDIYQIVTDKIVESLEGGSIPWLKPWKDGNNADPSMPFNASTGRAYNGINVLLLWSMPYSSNGCLKGKKSGPWAQPMFNNRPFCQRCASISSSLRNIDQCRKLYQLGAIWLKMSLVTFTSFMLL